MSAASRLLSPGATPGLTLRVALTATIVTMASQFYRNAHVVVAPDIMRDVGVSAQFLGYLSGALFLTAALTQIPAGVLIDRFGPRRTMPLMLIMAVAGSLIFASASGGAGLMAGRVLMGLGVAAVGMASIVASARWFEPRQFAMVAGGVIGLSQIGNLAATVPMALVSAEIGWRNAYLGMAGLTLLLALFTAFAIRDAPPGHAYHNRRPERLHVAFRGVAEVLAIPGLRYLLPIAASGFAVISCILGLWGGPYLYDVHGLDTAARGGVIFWLAAGMIVGNLAIGSLDRVLDTRKPIVVVSALATAAILAGLALEPQPQLWLVRLAFGAIGLISGYTVIIIAHGRGFYPDRLMGRGVTVVNTAVLGGAAAMQALTGLIAGLVAPGAARLPHHAYQAIFATLAALLVGSLIIYWRCPDIKPSATP